MRPAAAIRGFTLVELMVSLTLGIMVMISVMNAYLYLGRNLTRLGLHQQLEAKSRQAVDYLTQDLKAATALASAPTATSLALTLPTGTVTYSYDSGNQRLTRTVDANPAVVLLADTDTAARVVNCTAFAFSFYNTSGGAATDQSTPSTYVALSVKQVSMSFTLEAGTSGNATLTRLSLVTARFSVRNKAFPTGT